MTTDLFGFFDGDTPDRYIGQRVDILRRARRMQQRELALAAGIHRVSLSRKIAGTQPWQMVEVVRIANALDVSVADLIEGVERVALPRLDSNQQPFGYPLSLVRGQANARARQSTVADLAAYRAERVS